MRVVVVRRRRVARALQAALLEYHLQVAVLQLIAACAAVRVDWPAVEHTQIILEHRLQTNIK